MIINLRRRFAPTRPVCSGFGGRFHRNTHTGNLFGSPLAETVQKLNDYYKGDRPEYFTVGLYSNCNGYIFVHKVYFLLGFYRCVVVEYAKFYV